MKTIELENGQFALYTSIKELPIKQHSEYQKWLLYDGGVGSDIEAVARHFEKLHQFLGAGKTKEAIGEAENLHFNFFYQLQKINFKGMSFACLVHSINGQRVPEYSESTLKDILAKLSEMGLTQGQLETEWEDVKKKLNRELKAFFPEYFKDDVLVNMLAIVQKKNTLQLEYLQTDNNALLPRIAELESQLLDMNTPETFDLNKPGNAIHRHENGFESLCANLEDMGAQNVAGLTTFEFYARCRYYDKKFKPANP